MKNPLLAAVRTQICLRWAFSSKQFHTRLDRDPRSYVLHIDSTNTLSQVKYPHLVAGISDCMSSFYLVGFVILPHQTEKHFSEAFAMLHHLYTKVTNKQISVRYVMADADKGQRKAVNGALGDGNELVNLMCYYKVGAKVYKKPG
ncbi:MULE transposase domain-containing protein [Phytophthora infestans]|uniref:MULE transposase domain-containing protein n=1 Tax=Phytophthora infestans TaxID=4787 RepID=A0A833STA9_PHYIN|nr:MULE transposase domain-containing protein [Phytophthora infestans]KAF4143267.1 MULE transposase domain-containing protein [Phytophthora infestans]